MGVCGSHHRGGGRASEKRNPKADINSGYVFPEDYPELVRLDICPTVFRLDMAQELSAEAVRQGKNVNVHIKVDTGMSRIGFADTEESVKTVCEIGELPGIALEGLFTHFAKSDEADKAATEKQLMRYQAFNRACEAAGVRFQIHHCSNSAGIIDLPEANLDMVRAGITVYGLYPSEEVKKELVPLKPCHGNEEPYRACKRDHAWYGDQLRRHLYGRLRAPDRHRPGGLRGRLSQKSVQ